MATAAPQAGAPNPITGQDPNFVLRQMEAQRRAQMAQALMQQGLSPIETDQRGAVSWTQGLAKALAAKFGVSETKAANADLADLQAQSAQRMAQAYGMPVQSGGAGANPGATIGAPNATPGGGAVSPTAQSGASSSVTSDVLAAGAKAGSVGPTVVNAQKLGAALAAPQGPQPTPPSVVRVPTSSAAPGSPGWADRGQTGPLAPAGFGMLAWMADQGLPGAQEGYKAVLNMSQPTTEQKNAYDPVIGGDVRGNLHTQNMTPLQRLQYARAGVPDGSPQAAQLDAMIRKETYVAPIEGKPGAPMLDPFTLQPLAFFPKVGDGVGLNLSDPNNPTAYAIPGYAGASAGIVGAHKLAETSGSVITVKNPDGSESTGTGTQVLGIRPGGGGGGSAGGNGLGGAPSRPQVPVPARVTAPPQPASPTRVSAPQQLDADRGRLEILQQEYARTTNPSDRASLKREIDATQARLSGGSPWQTPKAPARQPAPMTPPPMQPPPVQPPAQPPRSAYGNVVRGADPTVQAGRTQQQQDMNKKWTDLNATASAAQTVNGFLDQIKGLSAKTSTGQFSDRQQFVNSLLSQFGSERATDAASAKNLLDKYSNQIVAKLGASGGMGTDAARTILQSAYPNSHMTPQAINEAVDALKAQNLMAQAKQRVLMQHYTSNNPAAYQQAEAEFDRVADPRIWQLNSMPRAEVPAYLAKLPPAARQELIGRVQQAQQRGYLQ